MKKCRKEVIDYKFSLPETADENSIVSEIAKAKDFIRIKWDDKKPVIKEVTPLKVNISNNDPVAPKVQLKRNDSELSSILNEASSRKHDNTPKTPKQVRFQLPGFSDRPRRISSRRLLHGAKTA